MLQVVLVAIALLSSKLECAYAHSRTVRAYAAEYKFLGADPKNSGRLSNVLKSISRSWAALANQLEGLAVIEKSEGK